MGQARQAVPAQLARELHARRRSRRGTGNPTMPTEQAKPHATKQPARNQVTRARFLEVRAGRLDVETPADHYSARLALSRRTSGPTD